MTRGSYKADKDTPCGGTNDLFCATVYHLELTKSNVQEMAHYILDGMRNGYQLDEDTQFGTVLITPDFKEVYVVPPEVIKWMVTKSLIKRDDSPLTTEH